MPAFCVVWNDKKGKGNKSKHSNKFFSCLKERKE